LFKYSGILPITFLINYLQTPSRRYAGCPQPKASRRKTVSDQFNLIQKDNPRVSYRTTNETFSLGRSKDCEIVIEDPHISRVQATVRTAKNRFVIKNVGRNPLLINGRPAPERYLKDGDVLTLGNMHFVFQTGRSSQPVPAEPATEEQTVVESIPEEEAADCRLMIAAGDGETRAVPIDRDKLVLGRSAEADVQLNDPLISRRHCVIERREEGMFARNVSATNPLLINGDPQTECRLYSGDRIRVGTYSIVFVSNLPDDIGQSEAAVSVTAPKSNRAIWAMILLVLLAVGGYFGYTGAYKPWQVDRTIAGVGRLIDAASLQEAEQRLLGLLSQRLSSEQTQQAKQMLAITALSAAEEKMAAGDVLGAKKSLSAHLSIYGSGPETGKLRDRLDHYSITLGKKLEAEGKSKQALHQYAAVRDGSLYQIEAQKGISRIWLKSQHQHRQEHTIVQLLKEGESHFAEKRYLTPVNRNAYAVYQAVLMLDPDHMMALKRIEQIKDHYLNTAETHFEKKKWQQALSYFERYRFIDPENKAVARKIEKCRRHINQKPDTAALDRGKSEADKGQSDQQRQEIKQLLESSGTESAWIMKYLFEEQKGEAETETPW
jgi:pSer/pThr/pTyr-binding forkhead associated (FHA) protein/tetratricopeptide (TPR) repeat protein